MVLKMAAAIRVIHKMKRKTSGYSEVKYVVDIIINSFLCMFNYMQVTYNLVGIVMVKTKCLSQLTSKYLLRLLV